MALYEFYCDCGFRDVVSQRMDEEHVYRCPKCNKNCHRDFTCNFTIKGWSCAKELSMDKFQQESWDVMEKADREGVTNTEVEEGMAFLIDRNKKKYGKSEEQTVTEELGRVRKKMSEKERKQKVQEQSEIFKKL